MKAFATLLPAERRDLLLTLAEQAGSLFSVIRGVLRAVCPVMCLTQRVA